MNPPAGLPPRLHRTGGLLFLCALVAACGIGTGDPSPRAGTTPAPLTVAPPRVSAPPVSRLPQPSSPPPVSVPTSGPAASAIPSPSPGPTTSPDPRPDATPRRTAFHIDLYRRGDFVSQARSDWCVPASIQMMARLIDRTAAGTLPSQRTLDRRARALSSPRLVGRGSEPQGWAGVLNRLGYGPYRVVAIETRTAAIKAAARALRLTGRPVGLLMWHGAHAWVMSGFAATADPARTNAFRVIRVRISDPWYPRATSAFGATRGPDSSLGLAQLAAGFLRWRRPLARYAELDGRFVLVLPVAAPGA